MEPDLSLVDPHEHHLATRVNVGDTLVRVATLFPKRIAVVDGDVEVTYAELASTADRLGHVFLGLGLEPGSAVVLMMRNSWQLLAAYYACARAGLVCTPLNVQLSHDDLTWIIGDTRSRLVVADTDLRGLTDVVLGRCPGVETVVLLDRAGGAAPAPAPVAGRRTIDWATCVEEAPAEPLEVDVPERSAVQCLYTSGTTSRPKGVLTSHVAVTVALLSNAIGFRQTWGSVPSVMLVVLPLFHTTALNVLSMTTLGMGGTVVLPAGGFTPAGVLDAIARRRVTHLMLLPMMYAACLRQQEEDPRDLTCVDMAIYAMAPMPEALLDAVSRVFSGADVVLGTGQTEVVPATAMHWPEHRHTAAKSWGSQAPSVHLEIMGPGGDLLPPDEAGEIVYRSPNVCEGYRGEPAAFAGGWFHSGDVGHLDGDRVAWFTDRLKDIVKTGGENVSSVAVEAVVLGVPGVAECSVIGVPHEKWGEAVCAVVVADGSVSTDELPSRIVEHAKAELAGFQVPKEVRIVESLPKTATGKIRKFGVRSLVNDGDGTGGAAEGAAGDAS